MAKGRSSDASRELRGAKAGGASVAARLAQAVAFHQRGQIAQAEALYRDILDRSPRHFDSLHLLGVIEAQKRDPAAAVELIGRAIAIGPATPAAYNNLGNAQRDLKRHEDALASFDRALALKSDYADAHYNRGNTLQDLGRPAEALASFDRALALKSDYVPALDGRGVALLHLERCEEALASFERALALAPGDAAALIHRAVALGKLKRYEQVLAAIDSALTVKPDSAEACVIRSAALRHLNRAQEALAGCDRVLRLHPAHAAALNGRGDALLDLGRLEEALASYERALLADPVSAEALNGSANTLLELKRYEEAARFFAALGEAHPGYPFARGHLLYASMLCCDWQPLASLVASISGDLRAGRRSAKPFGFQAIATSARESRRCAEIYAADAAPRRASRLWTGERYDHGRIRIGYVSGEFRQQATSILMVGLFELHDRSRFELFAFDSGWDDASEIRDRLNRAFDETVDITGLSDREAATIVRERQIDILVDLNGYFGLARTGVFSWKPAPVQVNYLGFPGTLGADCYDYIVADARVIPPDERDCYVEKVVYLPDTYQANDSRRRIAERTPSRAELGLPGDGFVFCCFNNNYKITPTVFDVWIRLLAAVPGSVLWLLEDNAAASRNLRREAERRGVAGERLVFAPRAPHEEHLARHRVADLFLDTLPYNAHTTASDALWAGLPVVTCLGTTFPGRVAASLLEAIGLPELVAHDPAAYEALALEFATTPDKLSGIRRALERNRVTRPLFDTERFRRHLEAAYIAMWERYQRGEGPEAFAVPPVAA